MICFKRFFSVSIEIETKEPQAMKLGVRFESWPETRLETMFCSRNSVHCTD